MTPNRFICLTLYCLLAFGQSVLCQEPVSATDQVLQFPDKFLDKVDPQKWSAAVEEKSAHFTEKIISKSQKTLSRLQKQEENIWRRKLTTKDSVQARLALEEIKGKYAKMHAEITSPLPAGSPTQYIPKLDSLSTSLQFLRQNGVTGKVKDALAKTDALKDKFQQAEAIKAFIKQRKQQFKQQLESFGLTKELKKFTKEAYYYSAQLKEYRSLVNDYSKLERKALELLGKSKPFQDFIQRNSMLAQLFRMPGPSDPGYAANMAGLQTSAQVSSLIQQQLAGGGPNALEQFQQNMMDAQSQLQNLKNKINAQGGSSEEEMPDFKPNNQKTKSFLHRLEYGFNLQASRGQYYFPNTSDLALSLGYKVNDRSVVGVGAAYKLGVGRGWNHISFTHEGAGVRSYLEWKLKGSFWLSGGYEMNYKTAFNDIAQLRDYSAWQRSGLVGISKKYQVGKKLKGSMQLLWDFLSYQQTPRTQAIIFRVGYNFK
jgi:hypothetical protein